MEDSLMEEVKHSFRVVGDKNQRQANFSTSVILMRQSKDGMFRVRATEKNQKNTLGDGGFQTHLYLLCMMA